MNKSLNKFLLVAASTAALGLGAARAADPVITDPAVTSIGIVTGGDVGEGLDLEGDFTYALSLGAEVDFSAKIRDATFLGLIDAEVPGATHEAGNRILNWYVVNYGDSANDEALKAATSSIRWSNAADANLPEMRLTLENLQIGSQYKFQLIFGEQCCNRGFDILFDDQLVVKDFNPGVVHGGIANGTQEALITHTYIPKASKLVIRFDGREASTDYSDHNAIINAVTVEKLGAAVDTDKDGMPDAYEAKNGFNPNDASDAAKDFDGDGVSNLDEFKAGTDPIDVTKPTVVSASATASFNTVNVTFSEEVDPATATVAANYTITPALAVSSVTYKKKVATLTTAAQAPGGTAYTVAVKGVKDGSKNEVPADSKAVFYSYLLTKVGALKISVWENITGTPVDGLYGDERYPNSPTRTGAVFSFNSRDYLPTDSLENYGAVMEGYLTPSESGNYRFFIYSDDASQLLLSTDDKEANLVQIAEETGCCNNFTEPDSPRTSEPVALTAGKKYYIRMVYKEGGGGDYGQVAWRKEGDKTPAGSLRPIPGEFLSSATDLPAAPEGAFTVQTPAANARNVSPATHIVIGHRDGKTAWTSANVSLKFDGVAVTPTFTKAGNVLTLDYAPSSLLPSGSVHTVALTYPDPAGTPTTTETTFTVRTWSGPTKDKVGGYPAIITGSSKYTADQGGATGKAGDYGMDLTAKGGAVISFAPAFLTAANSAAANDEMSVAFWAKKYDIADSSAFNLNSPSTGNQRAFHAHVPWSDGHIYFDTVGCCNGETQRIQDDIANFPDYTGDVTWWTTKWHLFAFTKKAAHKQIWIDGKLFLEGDNTATLPTDIDQFLMGADGGGGGLYHAIVDDFSVYSKQLLEADVVALKNGTLPNALPASKGLIGYWDFNDAQSSSPGISNLKAVAVSGGNIKITFDGAGVIQSADNITGPFTDTTLKNGDTVSASGAAKFYRGRN